LGASTEEAQAQVAVEGVTLLVNFLTTGDIRHAVNMSPIDAKTLDSLRGFLDVAYRLGMFLPQFDTGTVRSCRLTYRGEVAEKDTKLLTASFACGLLSGAMDTEPNIVNAEVLLRERGIELVEENRKDKGAFASVMVAEVHTTSGRVRAAGTIFGHNMPRLVQLNDHQLEAYLDGILMVFPHRDVPGIIGSVGTTLGKHNVNIAQMAVGRAARGGESVGILNLDEPPSAEALAEVRAHPAIRAATVIKLPPAGKLPAWLQPAPP
jgi:D-3-phosphoglycerate dehydrogenase